jgi:hypothetical protein
MYNRGDFVNLSAAMAQERNSMAPRKRFSILIFILIMGFIFLLSACTVEAEPLPNTPTPSLTPLPPTETIVWFPSTETPTVTPTILKSPTPEQKPGVGALILNDNFSDEEGWLTSQTTSGNIVYGKNNLSLSVAAEKRGLQSFMQEYIPGNSYIEMTVNPSLCRNRDTYGLLLRAESENSYYRFVMACTGEIRAERYRNGELAVMQDWTPSGQLPPGAPITVRVGVWMYDNELRFFINDEFQFSVTDPVYQSGQLGVFARTADKPPLTVSFSNLYVYAINQ